MKWNGKIVAVLLIVSLLVGAGGTYTAMRYFQQQPQVENAPLRPVESGTASGEAGLEKIAKTFHLISQNYYRDVNEKKLVEGAVQGMIRALDDPYSAYMDPQTAKRFTQSLASSFEGIGAEVTMRNGKVTIISPLKNSPAEEAGLRPNDQIITINGKPTEGLSLWEAVMKIRGEKGTTVTLGIKRPGVEGLLEIRVTRDVIPLKTVYSRTIEQNGHTFGYIQITSFSEGTAEDFGKALTRLENKGIEGLVIDVRGNPGGYLGAVTKIGNQIIPGGKTIVQTKTKAGNVTRYTSSLERDIPYPIVGLINNGSASAAEILAAALKESGGYPLVGLRTFGKGTVQQQWKLEDGSNVKLTVMKWLTPEGHWIHEKGVKPSVKVKQPDYFYTHPVRVPKNDPLAYNENGDQIANAQEILAGLGFEPGRQDGYFSKQTRAAVRAFQRTYGLEVTGKIDAETAQRMQAELMEKVENPKNDLQLQTAIGILSEKTAR